MMPTSTEENYLKAIYKHAAAGSASTNALAQELCTTPASVTDMIKRLHEKGWLEHRPYRGASLTVQGLELALRTLRKHRLWEVFLVEKLKFSWDEVHETAEQLEHIQSAKLIDKLDEFLNYPRFDPHGDPIPDGEGHMPARKTLPLHELRVGERAAVVGVSLHSADFLQYLNRLHLQLHAELEVLEHISFDQSQLIRLGTQEVVVGRTVAENVQVIPLGRKIER